MRVTDKIFEYPKFTNNQDLQKKCCILAKEWCKKNLRGSKYHDNFPRIFTKKRENSFYMGNYNSDKNIIYIYLRNNNNLIDICETIIHEWKHFQQDIEMMYDRYIMEYGRNSENHPYERSAENYAKKHSVRCLEWIKKNIKNHV